MGKQPRLHWVDAELSGEADDTDRLTIRVDGSPIGEIVVYASYPGAWQRIHGYGDDERLWSFDIDLTDERQREKGYGSRAVRATCGKVLEMRDATKVVVDVRADNPRAIRAYEKAGFHKVRFLENHDDGDGDVADAWLMEFRP